MEITKCFVIRFKSHSRGRNLCWEGYRQRAVKGGTFKIPRLGTKGGEEIFHARRRGEVEDREA